MSTALAGIRVLDLAGRPGAFAGRILADLGAEVILVEPPQGSSTRTHAPFLNDEPGDDRSFAHLYFNTNKRSVVLNLEDGSQRSQFIDLVASADVLLDNQTPGELDGLELSHEVLRAIRPGLIQCSITPFGLHSEWNDRVANDLVAGAASGLVWLSGSPRGTPIQGGADPAYAMSGLAAASAITIALHQRQHSGEGSGVHIDLSMQEATALATTQSASPGIWAWHGRIPRRPAFSAALRCKDGGYVGHLVRPDRFDGFLAWADRVGIDHGMTSADWEWSQLSAPRQNNPVAETTLALAAALTRDEFAAGALEADIVCLPVLNFHDLPRTEQYMVNDQFLTLAHDELGTDLGFVRSPVDAMADGVDFTRAPTLGEHQHLLDQLQPTATPSPAATASTQTPDPSRALEGLRVVDFGWVLAAPLGTKLLASFGAEVIRIESATKPDSMRSQIGPAGTPDPDLGGLFNSVNTGKKSLAVDLTTEAGLQLVRELIATSDVVVNNFRPGAMERMGLGYESLRELRDDIVLLNLPGAHRKGPWAPRASMGNILMAASGLNVLSGFEGDRPRGMGIAYPDFTAPHLLTATILAAIRQRDIEGHGQELHLTQLSGVVSLLGAEWMQYIATGVQPPPKANRDPNFAPHGVYSSVGSDHSDDEWVALAVGSNEQWQAMCTVMGQPELASDSRFATSEARQANQNDLDEFVSAWTRGLDKWLAADQLQAVGVAAAPVEHLADTYSRDPQLSLAHQLIRQPTAPDTDIPITREAAQWVGVELRLNRAPGLGEHNEHIVRDLLGRSDEDYIQLVIDGVLG
ncbi:MAG: crotonobetainyl-CoA:carnitine CoA-transferase CaiB-like acyl-CoA transferase [Candidatus Poriferisodalaceae bacterium]|jgi:crotonobetainyl-CoA:carnitine CoA-transferase CaiB-like acyl-CoA transferase